MHGPCGNDDKNSPCMVKKKCIRHFPKRYNGRTNFDDQGFPIYRRRRLPLTVTKKKVDLDNRYVVPYNRDLLIRFRCHINLELCNTSRSLKYLFKYCLKGHDTATMVLKKQKGSDQTTQTVKKLQSDDEVKHYLDGRYVCASEAAWRILGFSIHSRFPAVIRLPVHLPDEKSVSFRDGSAIQQVLQKAASRRSKLEGWFIANITDPIARSYTYADFPQYYVWSAKEGRWKQREQRTVIGRLSEVHAAAGELFYLRMLLMQIKGATCFEDLRTYQDIQYRTFKETCEAMGLLKNDKQWHDAISENSESAMPSQLRELFVHIIANSSVADPLGLWKQHWQCMSDDIQYRKRKESGNMELNLTYFQIENYALSAVEKLLNDIGKSLRDFPTIPFPPEEFFQCTSNSLLDEEFGYDRNEMKIMHDALLSKANPEQLQVYTSIMNSVNNKTRGVFFVYGSGGCGKTYLWQCLCCAVRYNGKIVLPVASSGIAAVRLPGGRTAHSRFHIPLKIDKFSTAAIRHGTDVAELIQQTSLIIWDEAPMQHKHAFEAVDRSLRDIMSAVNSENLRKPFGGITVVFGGDFRQILPVIQRGSRSDIVSASLNRSKLWNSCSIFMLKKNMRLSMSENEEEKKRISEFSQWVLSVGNGKIPHTKNSSSPDDPQILIPDHFLIKNYENPLHAIVRATYPNFVNNMHCQDYLKERAILAPTNSVVDEVNMYILQMIPEKLHTYYSQDSLCDFDGANEEFQQGLPFDYLNSINIPCLPKHKLQLKVGSLVMLMRNLNQIMGLCNGTRMVVTKCLQNSIECQILCGSQVGTKHLIPRMELEPSDSHIDVPFKRIQFPLQLCFAMTINKSQGRSLRTVGLYLTQPVFSHGQLYVAVSRLTSPKGLYILIQGDNGKPSKLTCNVVYDEVFYNLPE